MTPYNNSSGSLCSSFVLCSSFYFWYPWTRLSNYAVSPHFIFETHYQQLNNVVAFAPWSSHSILEQLRMQFYQMPFSRKKISASCSRINLLHSIDSINHEGDCEMSWQRVLILMWPTNSHCIRVLYLGLILLLLMTILCFFFSCIVNNINSSIKSFELFTILQ